MIENTVSSMLNSMMFSLGCYSMVAIAIIGMIALACIESYGEKKETITDGLILSDKQKNQIGYTSTKDKSELLGMIATCSTDLRPAGTVIIDGEPVDVISEGGFVTKGSKVKIIDTDGSRVVVRQI